MGFASKRISRHEAQSLMKKYKISSPWPGGDESTETGLTMCVYDSSRDAFFARARLYKSEIESLLEEALPAICKSNLPPANKNLQFVFRGIPMEFSDNEEDIWKQRRV